MIVIDGHESEFSLSNYTTLEEILTSVMDSGLLDQRIVTDVLVDGESFSELYPHQAEDIDVSGISRLELLTVSLQEMASNVIVELPKVLDIMDTGGRKVATLLRQSEIYEGLELLQDITVVSRDYLSTVTVLRNQYSDPANERFTELTDTLSSVLTELADGMSNADWGLVADLLEFEYLPACQGWKEVIKTMAQDILTAEAA